MGDRDYRSLIKNSIDSIGKELDVKIDVNDISTIHLHEVVRCLRRSYYDRVEPKDIQRHGFNDLIAGLLQKIGYGAEPGEFDIEGIKLRGQPDMMIDDAIILYRSAIEPPETPKANDLLFLNACLWIFNKMDGIIIYITGDRRESSFSLSKNKKMFEEVVRRVRVFNNLLKEKNIPILEPSEDCSSCQYYERCFIKEKIGRSISIADLVGMKRE